MPPIYISKDSQRVSCTLRQARELRQLGEKEIKWIVQHVLLILLDMHEQRLVYPELVPENILLSNWSLYYPENFEDTLVDLAALSSAQTNKVALAYHAPETLLLQNLSPASNIWSLGMIWLNMLDTRHAHPPTPGFLEKHCSLGSFQDVLDNILVDIIAHWELDNQRWYMGGPAGAKIATLTSAGSVSDEAASGKSMASWADRPWWRHLFRNEEKNRDMVELRMMLRAHPGDRVSARKLYKKHGWKFWRS